MNEKSDNKLIYLNKFLNEISISLLFFLAQASTGKQGVLGPTKIYLAVQPNNPPDASSTENKATNPPPLAPVQQAASSTVQALQQQQKISNPNSVKQSPIKQTQPTPTVQQVCNTPTKRKVVVEQVPQALFT